MTLALQEAAGDSDSHFIASVDGSLYVAFAAAAGDSDSRWVPVGPVVLVLDGAAGSSDSYGLRLAGSLALLLQPAAGISGSSIGFTPDLSQNSPIELAMDLTGQFELRPPASLDDDD